MVCMLNAHRKGRTWELHYSKLVTFLAFARTHISNYKHMHDFVWPKTVSTNAKLSLYTCCLGPRLRANWFPTWTQNWKLKVHDSDDLKTQQKTNGTWINVVFTYFSLFVCGINDAQQHNLKNILGRQHNRCLFLSTCTPPTQNKPNAANMFEQRTSIRECWHEPHATKLMQCERQAQSKKLCATKLAQRNKRCVQPGNTYLKL